SASLDHIQCGHLNCTPDERQGGVNLGLYSITFNNKTGLDRDALEHYKEFRLEAERKGFRHFLEVFDPNQPNAVDAEMVPSFINLLRYVADGEVTAEEAVRAYHGVLQSLGIKPHRSLADDMVLHTNVMSYGGNGVAIILPPSPKPATPGTSSPSCSCKGKKAA